MCAPDQVLQFGRGYRLTFDGMRPIRAGRQALLAAVASVLLASCATSDGDVPFGLASPADLGLEATNDFPAGTVNTAASGTAQSSTDQSAPALPDMVATAPTLRPGSETGQQTVAAAAPEASPAKVPEATGGNIASVAEAPQPVQLAAAQPEQPRKRGFLASFFAPQQARAAPRPSTPVINSGRSAPALVTATTAAPAQPIVQLAATRPAAAVGGPALPGVRESSLFEIKRRSGLDDDSDIDLHEGNDSYRVASAAGLARLAPNGLITQHENVDVACLKPSLVRVLKAVEGHYGRKMVVTSGYRSPDRNRRARGARNSLHMYCAAADVQVEGVSKWELAKFVRSMPGRGGVGTYCHTESVHIDVGPERDWNWRCRRRK